MMYGGVDALANTLAAQDVMHKPTFWTTMASGLVGILSTTLVGALIAMASSTGGVDPTCRPATGTLDMSGAAVPTAGKVYFDTYTEWVTALSPGATWCATSAEATDATTSLAYADFRSVYASCKIAAVDGALSFWVTRYLVVVIVACAVPLSALLMVIWLRRIELDKVAQVMYCGDNLEDYNVTLPTIADEKMPSRERFIEAATVVAAAMNSVQWLRALATNLDRLNQQRRFGRMLEPLFWMCCILPMFVCGACAFALWVAHTASQTGTTSCSVSFDLRYSVEAQVATCTYQCTQSATFPMCAYYFVIVVVAWSGVVSVANGRGVIFQRPDFAWEENSSAATARHSRTEEPDNLADAQLLFAVYEACAKLHVSSVQVQALATSKYQVQPAPIGGQLHALGHHVREFLHLVTLQRMYLLWYNLETADIVRIAARWRALACLGVVCAPSLMQPGATADGMSTTVVALADPVFASRRRTSSADENCWERSELCDALHGLTQSGGLRLFGSIDIPLMPELCEPAATKLRDVLYVIIHLMFTHWPGNATSLGTQKAETLRYFWFFFQCDACPRVRLSDYETVQAIFSQKLASDSRKGEAWDIPELQDIIMGVLARYLLGSSSTTVLQSRVDRVLEFPWYDIIWMFSAEFLNAELTESADAATSVAPESFFGQMMQFLAMSPDAGALALPSAAFPDLGDEEDDRSTVHEPASVGEPTLVASTSCVVFCVPPSVSGVREWYDRVFPAATAPVVEPFVLVQLPPCDMLDPQALESFLADIQHAVLAAVVAHPVARSWPCATAVACGRSAAACVCSAVQELTHGCHRTLRRFCAEWCAVCISDGGNAVALGPMNQSAIVVMEYAVSGYMAFNCAASPCGPALLTLTLRKDPRGERMRSDDACALEFASWPEIAAYLLTVTPHQDCIRLCNRLDAVFTASFPASLCIDLHENGAFVSSLTERAASVLPPIARR